MRSSVLRALGVAGLFVAAISVPAAAAGTAEGPPTVRGMVRSEADIQATGRLYVPRDLPFTLRWMTEVSGPPMQFEDGAVRVDEWEWRDASPSGGDGSRLPPGATHETRTLPLLDIDLQALSSLRWQLGGVAGASGISAVDLARCSIRTHGVPVPIGGEVATVSTACRTARLPMFVPGADRLNIEEGSFLVRGRDPRTGDVREDAIEAGETASPVRTPAEPVLYDHVLRTVTLEAAPVFGAALGNASWLELRVPMLQWMGNLAIPPFDGRLTWDGGSLEDPSHPVSIAGEFLLVAQRGTQGTDIEILGRLDASPSVQSRLAQAESGVPAALLVSAGALGAVAATLAPYLRAGVAGFFTRIARSSLLDHPTRRAISDLVAENPGIQLRDACSVLGMHRSTVQHHLAILERNGLVRLRRQGRGLHLLPPGPAGLEPDLPLAAWMRRPTVRRVLAVLEDNRPRTPGQLVAETGKSLRTIARVVARLEALGVVWRERQGRRTRIGVVRRT